MQKNRTPAPSDSWSTNLRFYDLLNHRFNFDPFDPCPMDNDPEKFNGLIAEWEGDRIFVNPPYSRQAKEDFIRRGFQESQKGKLIVMLIPASTSTRIFHEVILPNSDIEFVRGRIPFEGIDRSGNWVNPFEGRDRPQFIPSPISKIKRGGQFDSLIVIFKSK